MKTRDFYTETFQLPRAMTGAEIMEALKKSSGTNFRENTPVQLDKTTFLEFGVQDGYFPYGFKVCEDVEGQLMVADSSYLEIVIKNTGSWGGMFHTVICSDKEVITFGKKTIKKFLESLTGN